MNRFRSYKYINTPSQLGRYSLDTIYQHKYSSMYHLDHHQVIFKSSSSSRSGSSSIMDHHWIIIKSFSISSKWCYLSIILVIGSSTEPSLFHADSRPSIHVGLHLLQHLYLTMRETHPRTMSEWTAQHLHISFSKNGSKI